MEKTPPPIHPRDRYPCRSFDVTLREVVGWPKKRVLAELGSPNGKSRMERAPRPTDGYFGPPGPKNFPTDAPYEMWYYHNVEGNTWVLYLAHAPVGTHESSEAETFVAGPEEAELYEASRRSFWQRIASIITLGQTEARSAATTGRPSHRRGAPIVVDVWQYPTGAVF
ncbi:MAG: hypothetical protein HY675_10035 [Chloroflexi bacterium]|nr:hypothetical protein [Chloroflexota bacterium]